MEELWLYMHEAGGSDMWTRHQRDYDCTQPDMIAHFQR